MRGWGGSKEATPLTQGPLLCWVALGTVHTIWAQHGGAGLSQASAGGEGGLVDPGCLLCSQPKQLPRSAPGRPLPGGLVPSPGRCWLWARRSPGEGTSTFQRLWARGCHFCQLFETPFLPQNLTWLLVGGECPAFLTPGSLPAGVPCSWCGHCRAGCQQVPNN